MQQKGTPSKLQRCVPRQRASQRLGEQEGMASDKNLYVSLRLILSYRIPVSMGNQEERFLLPGAPSPDLLPLQ